jgi:site-specific DNA-methyltransferase (adenine-specific)
MLFDDLLSMKGSHVSFILYNENCLDVLKRLEDNSVDSIVTDPPYGLSFMGKKWDYDVPSVEIWAECLRVLKPGGHLLAFAGTRTQHRMAVRIEDAGFEIRDMIAWIYGSGFPKSLDVSKAIDKAAGAEREVVGKRVSEGGRSGGNNEFSDVLNQSKMIDITAPATAEAASWQGWGTALKPALEPITVARKPLIGTVAENVLAHGTGGLNIDGCRVATDPSVDDPRLGGNGAWKTDKAAQNVYEGGYAGQAVQSSALGRWPANLILDGSDEVVGLFPDGGAHGGKGKFVQHTWGDREPTEQNIEPSKGSASRFFYCAKASKKDRNEGCDLLADKEWASEGACIPERENRPFNPSKNNHPTVKPTDLMRYLCRLVTPPGGVVLDPFMGSGSTGKAAMLEGFQFIGCELSAEYFEIAKARIEAVKTEPTQKDMFVIPK